MVDLPARKVGATDVPLVAPAVRCQHERALACANQYSYLTHRSLLLINRRGSRSILGPCAMSPLVVDRLVDRGPEVETDVRGTWGSPGALGHQDTNHVLLGIRIPGRAQAAVPAEFSDGPGHVGSPGNNRYAEPPAVAVKVARDQTGPRFLLWRQLVGCHGLDRGPRHNTLAAVFAPVHHHPPEGAIVVDGIDQTAGGRRECERAAPWATLGLVIHLDLRGLEIGPAAAPEPAESRARDAESCVLHA